MHITFFLVITGIYAFMALVNTCQHFVNRDKAYFFYAVYLSFAALNSYQMTNIEDHHFDVVSKIWAITFNQRITLISYLGFSIAFFKTDVSNARVLKIWSRVTFIFILLFGLELLVFAFNGNDVLLWTAQRSFTILRFILSLVCIYYISRIQSPLRTFYLTGTILLWIGVLSSIIFPSNWVQSDVLYRNPFVVHSVFTILEVVCFTVGLSYRSMLILKQKQAQIDHERRDREQLRNHIAADLHDDLGVGLSTIRLLGERAQINVKNKENNQQFQKITLQATDLIEKMSTIIWAMNSDKDTIESLTQYIRFYAFDYLQETHNLNCQFQLPNLPPSVLAQNLTGDTRRDVFLTVKEALHNIVKHADATTVILSIHHKNNHLNIHISDNGKGFKEKKHLGNGLQNMEKRMAKIGGICQISSNSVGNGVQIHLSLPLV